MCTRYFCAYLYCGENNKMYILLTYTRKEKDQEIRGLDNFCLSKLSIFKE